MLHERKIIFYYCQIKLTVQNEFIQEWIGINYCRKLAKCHCIIGSVTSAGSWSQVQIQMDLQYFPSKNRHNVLHRLFELGKLFLFRCNFLFENENCFHRIEFNFILVLIDCHVYYLHIYKYIYNYSYSTMWANLTFKERVKMVELVLRNYAIN